MTQYALMAMPVNGTTSMVCEIFPTQEEADAAWLEKSLRLTRWHFWVDEVEETPC